MKAVRLRAVISGRVQGVFFRGFAERSAIGLEIYGWVRNRADGKVEVVAEGTRENLLAFLAALGRGPAAARVDAMATEWSEATGEFSDFRILASTY